jgi:hypothetical protein
MISLSEKLVFIFQFNLTHRIRHLSFGRNIPGKSNPLDGSAQIAEEGIYLYFCHSNSFLK